MSDKPSRKAADRDVDREMLLPRMCVKLTPVASVFCSCSDTLDGDSPGTTAAMVRANMLYEGGNKLFVPACGQKKSHAGRALASENDLRHFFRMQAIC